jgi:hypothetical protein
MASREPRRARVHLSGHAALGKRGAREEWRSENDGEKEGDGEDSCVLHAGLMNTNVVGFTSNTPLQWTEW